MKKRPPQNKANPQKTNKKPQNKQIRIYILSATCIP